MECFTCFNLTYLAHLSLESLTVYVCVLLRKLNILIWRMVHLSLDSLTVYVCVLLRKLNVLIWRIWSI